MNRLIGLPVVCGEKRLGRVSAVTLTRVGDRVAGLLVQSGLHGAKWIPTEAILCVGAISVLVKADGGGKQSAKPTRLGRVCDTSGMRLGCVTDARLDEQTLAVDALEITFGPLDDLFVGRRWVRSFTVHPESGDIVVPCERMDAGEERR
jgi:uncharacterized protein YrrD